MQIVKITKEQLISFLTDEKRIIGSGSNGKVSIYDENNMIKIHQKEILNSYISNDFDKYLDVKIIDLDDYDTVVGNRGRSKENSLVSLEKLLEMLGGYLVTGKNR